MQKLWGREGVSNEGDEMSGIQDIVRSWYGKYAKKFGTNPDPYAKEHYYDFETAYMEGAKPDETGHWPSKYKKVGHPTYRYKEMDEMAEAIAKGRTRLR